MNNTGDVPFYFREVLFQCPGYYYENGFIDWGWMFDEKNCATGLAGAAAAGPVPG